MSSVGNQRKGIGSPGVGVVFFPHKKVLFLITCVPSDLIHIHLWGMGFAVYVESIWGCYSMHVWKPEVHLGYLMFSLVVYDFEWIFSTFIYFNCV